MTLEDVQQVAPRVLARLRSMADLPRYGTVAGQSVASLLWEELGLPVSGPVNDIDVFVNRSLPREMRGLQPLPADFDPTSTVYRKVRTSARRTSVSVESASYEHIKFLAMRFTTRILRTYADGLVNYTLIDNMRTPMGQFGHADDVSLELVEGFDLNLVSVGINLETGNVSASPGFLEFLSSHQIKVQTCNTPSHTMMRLASKCEQGQIQGVSCDLPREMDLLSAAITCQRAQDAAGLGAIDLFGPKYRKLHGRFAHLLPPLEHLPMMDDEQKIPGSDDPPQTVDLYRLLVPQPKTPENQWLLAGATALRNFSGSNLLYLSNFPDLYDIAHPARASLDPASAAARRQHMDELVTLADAAAEKTLEGFDLVCSALDMKVFMAPVPELDEKDQFAFFFGQQAAKLQSQADRAATAFGDLDTIHRYLLLNLREGADTTLQFSINPHRAWQDMVTAHGAAIFNEWARIGFSMNISSATDNAKIVDGVMSAIDAMGQSGQEKLVSMSLQSPTSAPGISSNVFYQMPNLVGPEKSLEFLLWLSQRLVPQWPDLSNADPQHASAAVGGWIASGHACPAQVAATATGAVAAALFQRAATMDSAAPRLTLPGEDPGPSGPAMLDDGTHMTGRIMDAITLQDIFVNHPSLATFALESDRFNQLVQRAAAHPDSRLDMPAVQALKRSLAEGLLVADEHRLSVPFDKPEVERAVSVRAVALLDQMMMQDAVDLTPDQAPPSTPKPPRGRRF